MARRLTESQKLQLVAGYRSGKSAVNLANEFGCSSNTVNRVVKGMIANDEYLHLKKNKGKESLRKENKAVGSLILDQEDLVKEKSKSEVDGDNQLFPSKPGLTNIEDSLESPDVFQEVVPLSADFGFENKTQKVALKYLNDNVLPEIVYLLVNQKTEIEPKPLNEFAEWSFLPTDEKDRNSISLFDNQRAAKRSCSRGQKVIKIPNSNIFLKTIPFLLSKGITRIIFDEQLIALDI